MDDIKEVLRGIRTPAWLVGLARAALESAALAALYVGYDVLTTTNELPDEWKFLVILAPFALRTVEGTIDHIDPVKVRRRAAADEVS